MDPENEPPFPALSPAAVDELTEEAQGRLGELKQQASDALEEGRLDVALEALSAAVALGCTSALLYSRRAQLLLQLDRPRAAVNDCTAALGVNPTCGKAFKVRGRARAKLEQWGEALADLQEALKIDFDEETQEAALGVAARAKEQRAAEELAACQLWEVVGGADKGGIIARKGVELTSPQLPERLSTGAAVRELQRVGERLQFRRVTGSGPAEGWISISLNDKVLACRVASAPSVGAGREPGEEPPFPEMSPEGAGELSGEASEQQALLKQQALDAVEAGDQELALRRLTEAIVLGGASALLYSRRAQVLLQLGRPRAAANDCTAALAVNPDSGKAFKIRARAHAKLRHWAEAHADFQMGLKIDYDDGTYEESVAVAARMREIQVVATERRVKAEEAESERKLREAHAAQEARLRAQQAVQERAEQQRSQRQLAEARYAHEPFFRVAKQQGYMSDFMGMKRGRCKCKVCDFYVWRPVRVSS